MNISNSSGQVRVKIIGTGSYLPERIVHNEELAKQLPNTSDEWIFSHTGISTRHLASSDDSPSGMGIEAAKKALDMAGVAPEDLGFILLSSTTTDFAPIPPTSCVIQRALKAKNSAAFDITAACCGFVYNLEIARSFFQSPHNRRPILVIATEMMSRMVDWTDHKTCVLFGDGAAAAVLVPSDSESCIVDTIMKADGTGTDYLRITGGCETPTSHFDNSPHILYMEGKKVFTFAIKVLPAVINSLMERNNLTTDDITHIIPHQANYRIIHSAATRLGFTDDRFFLNVSRVANTASASIPIAMDEMNRAGMLKRGDKIITAGFGAGLTYGGNLIIW
ncbi:MAG: beta-ketoacyl-ACP synthase III [Planctomycetia bacterium]|nr:beta-ketoacyl-ACP synthase III [Planctomycetia bacterium]